MALDGITLQQKQLRHTDYGKHGVKTTVSFIGSEEETVLSYGTMCETFSGTKDLGNEFVLLINH